MIVPVTPSIDIIHCGCNKTRLERKINFPCEQEETLRINIMNVEINISADVVAFLSILFGIYIAASEGFSRVFTVIDNFTWRVHYMTEQEVFTSYNPKTILQNLVSNFAKPEFQLEIFCSET